MTHLGTCVEQHTSCSMPDLSAGVPDVSALFSKLSHAAGEAMRSGSQALQEKQVGEQAKVFGEKGLQIASSGWSSFKNLVSSVASQVRQQRQVPVIIVLFLLCKSLTAAEAALERIKCAYSFIGALQ